MNILSTYLDSLSIRYKVRVKQSVYCKSTIYFVDTTIRYIYVTSIQHIYLLCYMFRLLWVILRDKFQDLLYILFYSFYSFLQFFFSTKTVRHKNCKAICTIGLEIYAWRWLIRVETCSKVNICVVLKLRKYILLLCRRNIL